MRRELPPRYALNPYLRGYRDMKSHLRTRSNGVLSSFNELEKMMLGPEVEKANNPKIFEISKQLLLILDKTDAPVDADIKLPYDSIFIEFDNKWLREEMEEYYVEVPRGILIFKFNSNEVDDHFMVLLIDYDDPSGTGTTTMYLDKNLKPSFIKRIPVHNSKMKKISKRYINIIKNLLLFINNPDVKMVEHKRSSKNKPRKNGKEPYPDTITVRIRGELKVYLDEIVGQHEKCKYSYWVRGHWRTLRSPKWKNKQGQQIWIPPYVKGEGPLVDHRYSVEKRKKQ